MPGTNSATEAEAQLYRHFAIEQQVLSKWGASKTGRQNSMCGIMATRTGLLPKENVEVVPHLQKGYMRQSKTARKNALS